MPRQGVFQKTDAKRKFVTAIYVRGVAEIPAHCPFGGDGSVCRTRLHDRRERKCGPGFALFVVHCTTHGRSFTLYPPGWFPWVRAGVVGAETVFSAATDAARGTLWPESRDASGSPSATTQRRQIAHCARWLGLDGDRSHGETVCDVLRVPLSEHVRARDAWASAHGRRARGRIVADVLAAVPRDPGYPQRLLDAVTKERFERSRVGNAA